MNETTTAIVTGLTSTDIYIGIAMIGVFVIGALYVFMKMRQPASIQKTQPLQEKKKPGRKPKEVVKVAVKQPSTAKQVPPQPEKPYTQIHNHKIKHFSIFQPLSFFRWWKHVRNFRKRILVIMHKENGFIDIFYVYYMANSFLYDEKIYIVDEDRLRWHDIEQTKVAEYYEGLTLPIRIDKLKTSTMRAMQDAVSDSQIEMNLNPAILYNVVKTEIIQKVMKGEELEAFLNFLKRALIINVVGVIFICVMIIGRFV